MRPLLTSLLLFCLGLGLVSCLDHRGLTPANPQGVRLKRAYTQAGTTANFIVSQGYTEYTYDGSGRFTGLNSFNLINNAYALQYRSRVAYDSQGRLVREVITDEPGVSSGNAGDYNFRYDSLGRFQYGTRDGLLSASVAYNSQNQVTSRILYFYRGSALEVINYDDFDLDGKGNISARLQTYINQSNGINNNFGFRRKEVFTYDQVANPYYAIPSVLYKYGVNQTNRNNVLSRLTAETNTLFVPFPPVAFREDQKFVPDYRDGLLVGLISAGVTYSNTRFEYEKY